MKLLSEIPGVPESPELFLFLVVYYGIMNDSKKIIEKMEFNESLTSA